MSYEYAGAVRVVNMEAPTKAPTDSWMGWSNGHWEGETLVVDVTSQNEDTWFGPLRGRLSQRRFACDRTLHAAAAPTL